MKFTEAQERFLLWVMEKAKDRKRIYYPRSSLRNFGAYMKSRGVEDLAAVTPMLIEEYKRKLQTKEIVLTGKHLSPQTVEAYLLPVRTMFLKATEWGWLSSNPAASLLSGFPSRQPLRCFLSHQEMEKVLARPDVAMPIGLRNRLILELMYSTGIRFGEVVDLNVPDVDLDKGQLHVKASRGGKERIVPLTGATRDLLNRYLKEIRPAWARPLRRGGVPRRSTALFYSPKRGPMSEGHLEKMVGGHVRAVRPDVPCAGLAIRYACGVRLLSGGKTVAELNELFGHLKKGQAAIYSRAVAGIRSKQR
jgi:integrase/recombinase XerD